MNAITDTVETGDGYMAPDRVDMADVETASVQLVIGFYADQAASVLARATRLGGDHRLAGVFALLARICEETDATVGDVRAGAGDEAGDLVDALTARPRESAEQTALRAVAHPEVAELIAGRGSRLHLPSKTPSTWWVTQPGVVDVFKDELKRQRDAAEAAELTGKYHYTLPDEIKGVIPIAWANAVYKPLQWLTEREYRSIYDPPRSARYDARRVRRINEGQHLIDCYESGMTPQDYATYVVDTHLTWKEIAAWHKAGLGVASAVAADTSYARNAAVARYAAQVTGDPRRIAHLYTLTTQAFNAENKREGRKDLGIALGWSPWDRGRERVLSTRSQVDAAWQALLAARGGETEARRILDVMATVPVPVKSRTSGGEHTYTYRDWGAWEKAVAAWDQTGLPAQRIDLLLAAGVNDPAAATSPDTAALSTEQLRLAATLRANA